MVERNLQVAAFALHRSEPAWQCVHSVLLLSLLLLLLLLLLILILIYYATASLDVASVT